MRTSGNEAVTLIIFHNYNHLFLEDPNGNISGYGKLLRHTNQLSEELLLIITDWFQKYLLPE